MERMLTSGKVPFEKTLLKKSAIKNHYDRRPMHSQRRV